MAAVGVKGLTMFVNHTLCDLTKDRYISRSKIKLLSQDDGPHWTAVAPIVSLPCVGRLCEVGSASNR